MTTDLQSERLPVDETKDAAAPGWVKLGMLAAASGILGGLAAAWFYRKTLAQLRDGDGHSTGNPVSGNSEDQDYDI